MNRADDVLLGSPYQGYSYAYPHKTAYRRFDEPLPLRRLWEAEDRSSLFLYVHLPFCEMRCGFCNLFTQSQPKGGLVGRYLDALEREVDQLALALGLATFSRFALGGGTPTFLSIGELERVLELSRKVGVARVPTGIETSPATAEPEKLAMLREWGVARASIGIQSFHDDEVAQVARPQTRTSVETALGHLKAARFPTLNLDLIYGLPNQTEKTWISSLEAAIGYEPEEMFLYPLYVRPLTGLGKSKRSWDDERLALYRTGRDLLRDAGYEQVSMRFFRRRQTQPDLGPKYRCQDDGMVGLGCGARSYTAAVHYSREYAVAASGIRAILADYIDAPADAFAHAAFGFQLDADDRRRRYAIQSLLQTSGLDLAAYRTRFGTNVDDDLLELRELDRVGLATRRDGRLALTVAGLERSDAIGPWLYSSRVRERMTTYEAR